MRKMQKKYERTKSCWIKNNSKPISVESTVALDDNEDDDHVNKQKIALTLQKLEHTADMLLPKAMSLCIVSRSFVSSIVLLV